MSGLGRQMALAQERYDAMQPPGFYADPDRPNIEDALEAARDELFATPAVFADALAELADPAWSRHSAKRDFPGREIHDIAALCGGMAHNEVVDCEFLQSHELVAIMACGEDRHVLAALRELRQRVRYHLQAEIAERAAELMREAA